MEYCKTQCGADQLIFEGYRYQKNRTGANGKVFWRCHDRLCPGRVVVLNGEVVSRTDHSHPPSSVSNHVEKYLLQTEMKCFTTTDTIPKLYNDVLTEIASSNNHETAIHMPTYPSIKSSLYRARQKKIPCLPRQPADLTIGEWAETITHERFLLRVDGDNHEKIIVLATDTMLQRLLTASTLYMDGTFAACPRLFYQLFTINIYIGNQQYPAVYALLPSKSRTIYNRLFTILKEEHQNRQLLPPRVLIDFELSLMQSVKLHFPLSTISGCYFHFHQCLYRWVQTKGHSRLYNDKGTFYVRSTAAIAFVPIPSVIWMTTFPINTWNHFMTADDRTNNSLEGWHNRLNRLAGRSHPNIWQLLQLLKQEAVSEVKIVQLQNGGLPTRQRKGWRKLNARIARMKARYDELSLQEYIQQMCHLTGL